MENVAVRVKQLASLLAGGMLIWAAWKLVAIDIAEWSDPILGAHSPNADKFSFGYAVLLIAGAAACLSGAYAVVCFGLSIRVRYGSALKRAVLFLAASGLATSCLEMWCPLSTFEQWIDVGYMSTAGMVECFGLELAGMTGTLALLWMALSMKRRS